MEKFAEMSQEALLPGALIPCDVLTGYLGSGKTTFLNRFLKSAEALGTAVVVNEVGEIGIDQLILGEVSDNVVLLDSGCLCCSVSGTLRETLLDIAAQANRIGLPLRKVVIETTGLAEPLPILHALMGDRALAARFELGRVITTVDARLAAEQFRRRRESARQVAVADVLVITKSDLVDAAQVAAVEGLTVAMNPRARLIDSAADDALYAAFCEASACRESISPLQASGHPHGHGHRDHADSRSNIHGVHETSVGAESFWIDDETSWPGISAWWQLVVERYGARLLRCKGIFRLRETQDVVLIQGVGTHFYPPVTLSSWPIGDARARMTVIGESLERDWLKSSLRAFQIDEAGLLPRNLNELDLVLPLQH
ncbi:CobW family GTP-binding protein [Paraburkholderia nemoris]|uniref:CobW family GTP-binding protein n=1 Tax=Paraburkholderia nemoris TaxID=2793076 RepID=UPI0038B6E717